MVFEYSAVKVAGEWCEGLIVSWDDAEAAVPGADFTGRADFVRLFAAMLADPSLPAWARAKTPDDLICDEAWGFRLVGGIERDEEEARGPGLASTRPAPAASRVA